MSAALRLREDYGARDLRALARGTRDANQTRRLLALAAIYEGRSRGAAGRSGVSSGRRCATGLRRSTRTGPWG